MNRIAAILPAAGLGTRMGADTPKQFLELEGTPLVIHSVRRIAACPLVTDIIVATRADVVESLEERIRGERFMQSVRVVRGGDSRQDSVALALQEVSDATEIVLVHDAVRPFVTREQIARVIEEARRCQAAILGIPAMDTVKEVKRASLPEDVALIIGTIPRERVVLAQTPQAFSTKLIKEAFARASRWRQRFGRSWPRRTARPRRACRSRLGAQHQNHAACRHGPCALLSRTRAEESMSVRCGIGYDLHRLAEGRKLIVGGIELPFDKGSVGHSDGDVLAHALCDALLGAAGLGDIGTHFPDTDPKWKGANSLRFLEHARELLDEKHFAIEHVDAVVILEKPKLGPHFPKMREALARALSVSVDHIHLKAKTNEGVDAVGRGEAIAAHVVATLSKQ